MFHLAFRDTYLAINRCTGRFVTCTCHYIYLTDGTKRHDRFDRIQTRVVKFWRRYFVFRVVRYSNKRAKTVNGNLKYRGEEYSSVYYPVPCVRSIAISVEVSRHDHSYTDLCLVIPCFHTCRVEEANERGTRVACGSIGEKSLRERKQIWIDSENWMNLLSKFFLRTPPKLNLHFYCEK